MQTNLAVQREQLLEDLVENERRLAFVWTRGDAPNQRLPVQPTALKNVQAILKPDEVLLEYVLDDPKSFCISVTHGAAHVLTLPVGRKRIEELARQFVDEVHAKRTGVEASKQLFGLLLGSVPEASAANRIIIAPDGVLNLLPFEALRDDTGEYLLKSHVISYVPSGTVLDVLSRVEHHERAPRPFLGIGDVVYENQGGAGSRLPPATTVPGRILRGMADLSGMELDPAATQALTEAAGDKSWLVRAAALEALAKRGDPSVLNAVQSHVSDEKDAVKFTAAAAVLRLTGIQESNLLVRQRKQHENTKTLKK